jgi:hypothetical protein
MTTNKTSLRKMLVLLGIAATFVTASAVAAPVLILNPPQLAEAQQGKVVEGSGRGEIECLSVEGEPEQSPPGNEVLNFVASKQRGTVSGNWLIDNVEDPNARKEGAITGGQISGKRFTLTGIESFDNLCFSGGTPATITITGRCGQGVTIQFRASNGEEGEFTGNVACAR